MQLTEKQEQAINLTLEKYKTGNKYVVISGYAGCGKSTTVKFIIEALRIPSEEVVFTSFTGKACTVLQQMGNKNVSTLHKLLYEHIPKPEGGFFRKIRSHIDYSIVVCDECSMVPQEMINLLLTHHIFVIFMGDPAQLPPVGKDAGNDLLNAPDIFLDEIMRQEAESDIIKISMDIREGKPLPREYKGNDIQIYPRTDLSEGMLEWADIVICATNKTRAALNKQMREMAGMGDELTVGDKIICTKNDWNIRDSDDNALVNGTIGYVTSINKDTYVKYPPALYSKEKLNIYNIDFSTEYDTDIEYLNIDKNKLASGKTTLDPKSMYSIRRTKKYRHTIPDEFEFGYAITCWKAQGSQWEKVLIIEENFPFDIEEHKKFLYTAVTRGSKKVVLIRP